VFLNALTAILSAYAATAAMDTFTASKGDKHPTDLAMLRGARLVTASETEEGRAWAEARIKQITGGDPITARFMRQDFFTFVPQFKLTIVGNHQPVLKNVDDAARRRFNIVPFTRKPSHPDPQLEEKLRAEYPAILRWMVDGCLDWQKHGLVPFQKMGAIVHHERPFRSLQRTIL
jgi:putative DNA primase/helicase